MKELIPIYNKNIDNENIKVVNARDLWKYLEIKELFAHWIRKQIKRGMFKENRDYIVFVQKNKNLKQGGRPQKEYFITFDTSKHIGMMARNIKGYEIREYFIAKEKELREKEKGCLGAWLEIREESKEKRKDLTDTIKDYIKYCELQGSEHSNMYYSNFTRALNRKLFSINSTKELKGFNLRDIVSRGQLSYIVTAEEGMRKKILKGMEMNMEYKDIYKFATEYIDKIVDGVGLQEIQDFKLIKS